MLKELLDTRVMVKHAMKGVKSDKVRCHFPNHGCCAERVGDCAVGFETRVGRPSTEFEVHLQRYVRLHQRNFFGEDARSRDRRQHCTKWP